jgi:SAM-dependent methyltransferase
MWNERFSKPGYFYGVEPNEFLKAQATLWKPGMRALAPGDGEGRNGVWLAQQGLDVLSVDGSAVGIEKAQRLAAERGVPLQTEVADLTRWRWPEAEFDFVASIFLHLFPEGRQYAHRGMAAALKPGGYLILEAFHQDQLGRGTGGPKQMDLLYTEEILREDFSTLEILTLERAEPHLDEGKKHRGRAVVVRLIARKPLA